MDSAKRCSGSKTGTSGGGWGCTRRNWSPCRISERGYRQHAQSQLATTRPADRARGHVVLMTRMATALVEHPDLLDRHAQPLFWNLWSALKHARSRGVSWQELGPAADALRQVATRGSRALKGTLMATAVRLFGARTAAALQLR